MIIKLFKLTFWLSILGKTKRKEIFLDILVAGLCIVDRTTTSFLNSSLTGW